MLALIFPCRGAQSDGFLHRLPSHPAVRATLDEASSVLGADVLTLDTPGCVALDCCRAMRTDRRRRGDCACPRK